MGAAVAVTISDCIKGCIVNSAETVNDRPSRRIP